MKADNTILEIMCDKSPLDYDEIAIRAGIPCRSLKRIFTSQSTMIQGNAKALGKFFGGKFTYVLTFTPDEQEDVHDK